MPRRSKVGGKRPGAGRKPAPGESFEAARRRKEIALADLRQIEVRVKRGELLEAEAVSREWCDMMRRIQARVLAVSSRLRKTENAREVVAAWASRPFREIGHARAHRCHWRRAGEPGSLRGGRGQRGRLRLGLGTRARDRVSGVG